MLTAKDIQTICNLAGLPLYEINDVAPTSPYPRGVLYFVNEVYPIVSKPISKDSKAVCIVQIEYRLSTLLLKLGDTFYTSAPFFVLKDDSTLEFDEIVKEVESMFSHDTLAFLRTLPLLHESKIQKLGEFLAGDECEFRVVEHNYGIDLKSPSLKPTGSFEWSVQLEERADTFANRVLDCYLKNDEGSLAEILEEYIQTFMLVLDEDIPLFQESILHEMNMLQSVTNSYSIDSCARAMYSYFRKSIEAAETVRQLVDLHGLMVRYFFDYRDAGVKDCDNPQIVQVQKYIRENYKEAVTRDALADEAGLNPNYLSWLFHKEVGCSLSEYLQSVRIERAKVLLKYTNLSISDIAKECGFSDSNYFSRKFREAEGTRPLTYRKQNL